MPRCTVLFSLIFTNFMKFHLLYPVWVPRCFPGAVCQVHTLGVLFEPISWVTCPTLFTTFFCSPITKLASFFSWWWLGEISSESLVSNNYLARWLWGKKVWSERKGPRKVSFTLLETVVRLVLFYPSFYLPPVFVHRSAKFLAVTGSTVATAACVILRYDVRGNPARVLWNWLRWSTWKFADSHLELIRYMLPRYVCSKTWYCVECFHIRPLSACLNLMSGPSLSSVLQGCWEPPRWLFMQCNFLQAV